MPRIEAVLFDFGHTLFDTPSSVDFLMEQAARRGVEADRPALEKMWLRVREESRTAEAMSKGRDLSATVHLECWLELFEPFDTIAPGLAAALYAHETSAAGWQPYPDAAPLLARLTRAGLPIGVVSDTGWDIRPVFSAHGLADAVGVFVLSGEYGVTKPAPVLFEAACTVLGVEPATTLMVGDNHRTDGGAVEAGLLAFLLPLPPPRASRGLDAVARLVGVD
jgi:HAD superfamily hydrolase (TIGR01509 family)